MRQRQQGNSTGMRVTAYIGQVLSAKDLATAQRPAGSYGIFKTMKRSRQKSSWNKIKFGAHHIPQSRSSSSFFGPPERLRPFPKDEERLSARLGGTRGTSMPASAHCLTYAVLSTRVVVLFDLGDSVPRLIMPTSYSDIVDSSSILPSRKGTGRDFRRFSGGGNGGVDKCGVETKYFIAFGDKAGDVEMCARANE